MTKKRNMVLVLCLVLVTALASIGGTIAWITANSKTVTNTFTVGDINIDLNETTTEYKLVPGNDIKKDPVVTVEANSEDCWLFVKVEETTNLGTYIKYDIADGWTALTGVNGVYYREVSMSSEAQNFPVLAGNKVTVLENVTKTQLEAAKGEAAQKLIFTAYAVQQDNLDTAAEAWAKLPTA